MTYVAIRYERHHTTAVLTLRFILYFGAGVTTGLHLLFLSGANNTIHPLQMVGLVGSLGLVFAAYLSLFKPDAAAKLALLASLLLWCFYGPAVAKAMSSRAHSPAASIVRQNRAGGANSGEGAS